METMKNMKPMSTKVRDTVLRIVERAMYYNNTPTKQECTGDKPTFFVKKDDNRHDEYVQYKKKHGFSPDEMWDLKTNIAIFISPRLKEFRLDIIDLYNYPNCDDCKKDLQSL